MVKIVIDYETFPSGSHAYNVSREPKTKEDFSQYIKELTEGHRIKIKSKKGGSYEKEK